MHLSAGAHGRSRTVVHGAPRCQAAGMHQGAGAHRWWCTVVHGAIRCQAAGMHLGARCTQASVHLLRDSLITHNTTSVPKRPDAPRCTVHLGARRPGCTLVQVHKRPDAPRCTVQYGARRPGCTSVQVHGDPNAPHQGAGAARAPCVTLTSGCPAYFPSLSTWPSCAASTCPTTSGASHDHSSAAYLPSRGSPPTHIPHRTPG